MPQSLPELNDEYRALPNAIDISHERIDDEIIIINLATGSYFAGTGVAADVWSLLSIGQSIGETISQLSHLYQADESVVSQDVYLFAGRLVEFGLLEAISDRPVSAQPTLHHPANTTWHEPQLTEYTDMWDLIRLDPIHDVEEIGWPHALPESHDQG